MSVTSRFYGGSPIRNRMGGRRVRGREEQKEGGGAKGEGRWKASWLTKWVRLTACSPLYSYFFLLLDVRPNGVHAFFFS